MSLSPTVKVQWWVAALDGPGGPYTQDQVATQINCGDLDPTTLVCPINGDEWRPARSWPELAAIIPPPLPFEQVEGTFFARHRVSNPLTNPRLPPFANWICIYCMVIVPADEYQRNDHICDACAADDEYPLASTPEPKKKR